MVALERGIKFSERKDGVRFPNGASLFDANDALADIAQWLHFDNVREYCKELEISREKIFERAEKEQEENGE